MIDSPIQVATITYIVIKHGENTYMKAQNKEKLALKFYVNKINLWEKLGP